MNKIILAYCRDNAELAYAISQPLSRIGIPFEHVVDQAGEPAGQFAAALQSATDPVLLLVTDNFLKNRHCMADALNLVQTLSRQKRLLAVVANGVSGQGEVVETQIDRMVNAIQYTNYWQSIYLDLSARQSQVPGHERLLFDAGLATVRDISNEIFDLLTALRESEYLGWNQLVANDFALFFKRFGLGEWHEQYRRLNAPADESQQTQAATDEKPVQSPVLRGPLAPSPAESETLSWPDEPAASSAPEASETGAFNSMDNLLEAMPTTSAELEREDAAPFFSNEPPAGDIPQHIEDEINQTIRDAWFWLENGHVQQGLQVFQLALEEHPHHPALLAQYEAAFEKYAPKKEPSSETNPSEGGETLPSGASEAKSYDLIGEESLAKGDYLFAKFCWDRVAEISPNYPNIYRKLGLLTSEHLREYRETAIHYLEKALESDPEDLLVRERLASMLNPTEDAPQDDLRENPFVAESLESFESQSEAPGSPAGGDQAVDFPHGEPEIAPLEPSVASLGEQRQEATAAPSVPQERLTVLITGATSGIGRATAILFAQHGHRLILTGRRAERLEALEAELQADYQGDVLTLNFDVRDNDAVRAHLENLPEAWRNVDVLLNNAGLAKGLAPIHEGNLDHWETMIDTNLKGLLYVTRCVAQHMVRRHRGHIINLGSSAGKEVYAQGNVYCATKFAVDALTRAMRLDLHTHNIRVSQVSPGHVEETEFALNRFDGDSAKAQIYNDFQPLKAGDVAEVIYFIATRPRHVNIQDVLLYSSQQASATVIDRSGRE